MYSKEYISKKINKVNNDFLNGKNILKRNIQKRNDVQDSRKTRT